MGRVGGRPLLAGGRGHMCWTAALLLLLLPATAHSVITMGNPDAKRLYDDLLSNYNKLVRPVQNTTDPLTVRIKLKLSQLIDVVSNTGREHHSRSVSRTSVKCALPIFKIRFSN